jgi:succinate dehydrogenase hydrophobic anchor subunit
VIRNAGGVALVVRRASGLLLTIYFAMWLARLHRRPLVPFGGDLGRDGSPTGKVLEMALIALLSVHAFEGLSQLLVERLHVHKQRAFLVTFAVLLGLAAGAVHFFWFFGGRLP